MDTGEGRLIEATTQAEANALERKYPQHGGWFHVGEILTVKGSKFRVKSVKPTELRLKLLPKKE